MFSALRQGLVYKDISPDVTEHDDDIDADQWNYDGKDVYRGTIDPRYTEHDLNVYWLYDDDLNRIGLAEHDSNNSAIFHILWFYKNPFATLFQTPYWQSKNKTLWSMLSNEAYQECLEDDFKSIFDKCLDSEYVLITPEMVINPPKLYTCKKCNKKSLSPLKSCKDVIETSYFSSKEKFLFLDESFILYDPPSKHSDQLDHVSYEPEPELEQEPEQENLLPLQSE
jgi:hypothetical protein